MNVLAHAQLVPMHLVIFAINVQKTVINVNLLHLALNANLTISFQKVNVLVNVQMALFQIVVSATPAPLYAISVLQQQNVPNVMTDSTSMLLLVFKTVQKVLSLQKEFAKNAALDATHAHQPLHALNVLLVYH